MDIWRTNLKPTWEHWDLPSPSLPCTSSSRPAFQVQLRIKITPELITLILRVVSTSKYQSSNPLFPPICSPFRCWGAQVAQVAKSRGSQKILSISRSEGNGRSYWLHSRHYQLRGKYKARFIVVRCELTIIPWTASLFDWPPPPPLRLSTTPLIFFSTLRVSLLTQLLSLNSSENLTLICWNTLDVFVSLICVCVFVLYNWVSKVLKVHHQPLFRCSAMAMGEVKEGGRPMGTPQ